MYQILHVDDDPDLVEVTAERLKREDGRLEVATETDASRVLDRLEEAEFDCIVSDYQMPAMDGLSLLDRVRDDYPNLPFILFTGKGSEEVASDAIARGVTDYLQKQFGSEQYELLANRCLNAINQYRAEQRASSLDRIRNVVRTINQELIRAETREELYQRVCERIADADPYRFAWIGTHDSKTQQMVPRASAGLGADYLSDVEITVDDGATGRGPTGRAVTTREMQVMQDIQEDPAYEPWREAALERGYESSAAVPLVYDDDVLAVLNVYASRPYAFDDAEQELLVELGDDIAHELHALETETHLRQTTARLEALFDDSPNMINVHDAEGRIVDANHRICEVLGYAESELVGKRVWEVDQTVEPDDVRALWDEMEPGDREEVQGRYRRRDGSTFPVEVHISRLDRRDGRDDRFVVISRDVSEREARERELERRGFLFERVQEIADIGVWEYDVQTDDLTWSDGVRRIHGVDESYEPTLEDAVEFYHPDDRDEIATAVDRAIEGGEWYDLDLRLVRDDGQTRDVRARGETVTDREGETELLRGVFQDITERKERERALERYERLVENLPVGVYQSTFRSDGTFTLLNDAMVEIFDAESKDELQEYSVSNLYVNPEDRERFNSLLAEQGVVKSKEIALETLEGEEIWGGVTGVARDVDGKTVFDGAIEDITERKEYEQRLETQRDSLDILNQVVRHDIRNDLQLVLAYVEVLEDHVDDEGQAYIETVLERTEQAVELTRTARVMADVMLTTENERRRVGIKDTLGHELDEVRSTHSDAVVTVEGSLPDATVQANDMLDSVFRNLLENAIQHNDEDVPEVVVSATVRDDHVVVRFADNGPGVSDDQKGDVFGKGEKGLESDGTGVGLYLVQTLVDQYGGEVRVDDNDPEGAVFTVELPTAD